MKRLLSLLLTILVLLVNGMALGRTLQLDKWNIKFEIPDNFSPKDEGIPNSVYTAETDDGKEVICIAITEGSGDVTDPVSTKKLVADTTSSGFHIITCFPQDIGAHKFFVMEVRNAKASQAHYLIFSENHLIDLCFSKSPASESRILNDPIGNNLAKSFDFIETPVIPKPKNAPTLLGDLLNLTIIAVVVVAVLALWKRLNNPGKA